MAPQLETPVEIGGLSLRNRLYRAPLLECAGNGPDAVDTLIADLEPAAASGAGLVCQGATVVRGPGGCAAPNMTYVDDPAFVEELSRLTDAIHDHGAAIAIQLEHGGLRSLETWHHGYRSEHPDLQQLAVSQPPRALRVLDRLGLLSYDPHVLSTDEVYELAADFGRSAKWATEAGYDIIHIAGANMGIVHQFCSPFYNRRDDEFADGVRFLELVASEIRQRCGDVPLMTKVPAESATPPGVGPHLSEADAMKICERLEKAGFDALVPVTGSVIWDMSIIKGEFPGRAWSDEGFSAGYSEAFGGPLRRRLAAAATWLDSRLYNYEPAWNSGLCRRVRERVDVPVLAEGGIRTRGEIDALLGTDCDLVGLGRPFYAEPRLPARLLEAPPETAVVCENCNNCTVPQAAGEPGVCRTPAVLAEAGRLRKAGAYDRLQSGESATQVDDS
ncbi:NADH:flavin oxidoreductase [Halohasta litorea]|uniref:NADH:flavin oxidoreductase n=1 Tax=Halohasta litorea TaxID=869891 RepID=A0ABD6D7L7_9EURY|nr:NADH:flavin oxidoreductase [Halohasta litorea]